MDEEYEEAIQELDYIVGKWQRCMDCHVVDTDRSRTTPGNRCTVCGHPSEGGVMYFETAVHLVVDLIKEAASTENRIELEDTKYEYKHNTHYVSVLLFFCTLREILLNGLVEELYFNQAEEPRILDRLNSDNRMYTQKLDRLFPTLAKCTWSEAITEIDAESKYDYIALNKKVKDLSNLRNQFTHEGYGFAVDQDTAKDCVMSVEPLIHLYVDLHNKFVHSPDKATKSK